MNREEALGRIIYLANEFVSTVDERRHLEALPSDEFIARVREYEDIKTREKAAFYTLSEAVKEYGNGR